MNNVEFIKGFIFGVLVSAWFASLIWRVYRVNK